MERIKQKIRNAELSKAFDEVAENAVGNPIIFETTPEAKDMKPNTIAKVKDATDYVFVKFPDGKTIRIPVEEVT